MARGRKRSAVNPTIPSHVDPLKVPAGIYWDKSGSGRWYVRELLPNGKSKVTTVAQRTAMLSDLHAIAEARAGRGEAGTIGFVMDRYHESTAFADLAPRTREDYGRQREIVKAFKLKTGASLATLHVDRANVAVMQRVLEVIAKGKPESRPGAGDGERGKPTKANHLIRYLRLVFSWAVRLGYCKTNPCKGVKLAKEKGDSKMPELQAFKRVVAFARERGALKAHTTGSCAPYLWAVATIAYYCRLRLCEVIDLTDADKLADGIYCRRRKGSLDTVTQWSPELSEAWDALVELRAKAWKRHGLDKIVPLKAQARPLVVSEDGAALRKSSLDSAWQRIMRAAMKPADEGGVITEADRFALHGIKHRGITDSGDKDSGGHKTEAMKQRYDHAVKVFAPAGDAEYSGEFSGTDADSRVGS